MEQDREDFLERHAPWGFVVVGVAMIAVVSVGALSDAVAVTFAVLGTGLLALGGLAGRLEGPIELGSSGLKAVLRVRRDVLQAKREAERENRPEDAERYGEVVEALDDWFAYYLRQERDPNPFIQAARLERAWRQRRQPPGADATRAAPDQERRSDRDG